MVDGARVTLVVVLAAHDRDAVRQRTVLTKHAPERDEHACEKLVSLAEEGWSDGPIARDIVQRYIDEANGAPIDTIILGCTHFPLLKETIGSVAGDDVVLVDSASTTAEVVRRTLDEAGIQRSGASPGTLRLLATDGATRFARVGGQFLGHDLSYKDVEVVDL